MKLITHSSSPLQALDKFEEIRSTGRYPQLSLIWDKLALSSYEVLLVSYDLQTINLSNIDKCDAQEIIDLYTAWGDINQELNNMAVQARAWANINRIGEFVSSNTTTITSIVLRRFRDDKAKNRFFLLLSGREPYGLPIYELNFLSNLWQVEHDRILLHAGGVIHQG